MKLKRYISFLLTICMMLCSFTTSVYAIDGCDGVLDAGEIELESYIEWNTFKSSVDGLSSEAMEEIRSAEERGNLPEMYPIGESKVLIKTDIGFYLFKANADGSYESMDILHFAHLKDSSNYHIYTGTGTIYDGSTKSSSYSDTGKCCWFGGLLSYGYYGDNFYIVGKYMGNDKDLHDDEVYNTTKGAGYVATGYIVYKIDTEPSSIINAAMHSYSSYGGNASVRCYWGNTSFFVLAERQSEKNGNDETISVQEYDFSVGKVSSVFTDFTVVASAKVNGSTSLASRSGRFTTSSNTSINLERSRIYPYAQLKIGTANLREDYMSFGTHYGVYSLQDNGKRTVKPFAGFISLGDKLHNTRDYYNSRGDSNAIYNALGQTLPVGSNSLSVDQISTFNEKLKMQCNENGIPFYGVVNRSTSYSSMDTTSIYSSRLKRKGADGKTYYDGQFVLNRTVKPQLGSDGKYILGQTTTMYVGGGLNKNSSKLTFKNISLGSDATIEIYGITDTGAQNLLETITNAKNSVGTYTTGQYNYGYLKIVFNGGTSTSGRGEGFILSDVKYGQFGVADYDYTFVDAPQISAPTFGFSNLGEALIPCGGIVNHTATVGLSCNGDEYRNTVLLKENVYVEKGKTVTYKNSTYTGSDNRYTPWYWNAYISIVDPNDSSIRQNMTVADTSRSATTYSSAITLETGYYDIYGYVGTYSSTGYASWGVTISGTEYKTANSEESITETINSKEYNTSRFNIKKQVVVNKSNFPSLNTVGSIKVIDNLDLDIGDTIVLQRKSSNTYLDNYTGMSFYSPGTTTGVSCYSSYAYTKDSNGTGMAYWVNADTNIDLYFIHNNYTNASYQLADTDEITITIYEPRYLKDFVFDQSNLNSTTTLKYVTDDPLSGNFGYMYDLTMVRGGVTSTSGYRLYIGGTYYYLYNSGTTKGILDGSTAGIGSMVGSTSYTQIDSSTKATIKMYETAFRVFMPTVHSENKRISTVAPAKSGYTPVSAVIEITLPRTANGDYTMYAATKQDKSTLKNTTVFSEVTLTNSADVVKTVQLKKEDLGKDIVLYSRANRNSNYAYLEKGRPFKYKITWYYADNAGTELHRYAPTSTKTITHKVGSMEDEFVNIKVTEFNVPDGMSLYVNGTKVTSAPYETGWLTSNYINMQLQIPGNSIYGLYDINSLDEVCKYELQTKDLADATSKQSFTNVNLGELKPTSTYNSSTGKYTYGLERSDAVITGVTGGYIQIVSTLETPNYGSYDSEVPITGTVTGIRGLSNINSALVREWDTCEIGTTDWLQPTQDTVTISCTASGTSYNSTYYCPSGYTVKDYYRITASNIPDSKIKTYQSGMVNVVFDNEVTLGEKFSQEALDNSYSSILTYTNVPKTKTNGLASTHGNYSTSSYGQLTYIKRDGTVTGETGAAYRSWSPGTFKSMIFKPSGSGTGTFGESPTVYIGTYIIYNSYQLDDILGSGGESIDIVLNSAMPLVRICGARNPNTPKNVALASDTNYSMIESIENNALRTGKKSGDTMSITDWAGKNEFDDGRYGVAKMGYELWYSNKDYYTVGRIDVYREYSDGTIKNIAMIPVTATDTFFDRTGGLHGNMEEAPPVYHIGNDLMYIASKEIDSRTDGNAGASMAWLRTGHWHLKGSPDEIEGITFGGVQNPIKNMDDDAEADTEVLVNELDMDAESWTLGHTIKDGRVTEEKLSDDVKDKINELNLGTFTVIRNNGAQYKMVPFRDAFKDTGSGTQVLQDCTLKYGSHRAYVFAYDTDQILVGIDKQVIGDLNSGGSNSSNLSVGNYIFKGTTTYGNDEINVVLQVNVIDAPDKDTETTLTFN